MNVTLTGRFGIAVTTNTAQASTFARFENGNAVELGIVAKPGITRMTYGVGTTGDPALTVSEWVSRAIKEDAANIFRH